MSEDTGRPGSQRSVPLRLFLSELDVAGYWYRRPFTCLALIAAFGVAHAAFVLLGHLIGFEQATILVIWPAAGLLAGIMAATPARTWALWALGTVLGRFIAEVAVLGYGDAYIALGYSLSNVFEALLFGILSRKPLYAAFRLSRPLYAMAAISVFGLLAPLVGGLLLLGAGVLGIAGSPELVWSSWRMWIVADYLGVLVVTPVVMWFLVPQLRFPVRRTRHVEQLAFVLLATLIFFLIAFLVPDQATESSQASNAALAVLMVLPLIWAALRFSSPVVGLSLFMMLAGLVLTTAQGIGPLAYIGTDLASAMGDLQIYSMIGVQTLLLISFANFERRQALFELDHRARLQRILLAVTERLIEAGAADVDARIDEILADIGHWMGADRVHLARFDLATRTIGAVHRWHPAGQEAELVDMTGLPLSSFRETRAHFEAYGYLGIDDVHRPSSDVPADVAAELAPLFANARFINSSLYIGLFTGGTLTGFFGCSWRARNQRWTAESLSLLFLVGQLLANVLRRKTAEAALDDYRDKLRKMAVDVSLSEERARRRAAIDLHDGIGQNLAVARMRIGQLLAEQPVAPASWNTIKELVDQALAGTRHVIADLSPAILYELGLVPALQSLAEQFTLAHDIDCEILESGDAWELPETLRVMLHRSVRELLANVARHSRASSATVSVDWSDADIRIEVRDDGIGMDAGNEPTEDAAHGGFGMFSIRETVLEAGGQFSIETTPGLGTRVTLAVPKPA